MKVNKQKTQIKTFQYRFSWQGTQRTKLTVFKIAFKVFKSELFYMNVIPYKPVEKNITESYSTYARGLRDFQVNCMIFEIKP